MLNQLSYRCADNGHREVNLFTDTLFRHLQGCLGAEMKCLTELGVGSNAKEAQSLSKDENKLWNLGLHHRVLLDIATTFFF